MTQKLIGIGKAAIAGAVFGSAVGIAALPKKYHRHRHYYKAKYARKILRTIGIAMENLAELIR